MSTTAGAATGTPAGSTPGPLWWPRPAAEGQRPVLFFPPSGAEPTVARPLVDHAAGLALGVVEAPGRGRRHDEPHPRSLSDLVAEVTDAVVALGGPPPVLVGHSLGGLVAYEVAAALERRGRGVGRLVAVASRAPASTRAPRPGPPTDPTTAVERVLARGGVPTEVLDHPELAARARELVRVDAVLTAEGFGDHVLEAPVTSWVASDDRLLEPGAGAAWAEATRGGHTVVEVTGGHFFWRQEPTRLMHRLRMEVADLDGVFGSYA